jgi:hypothetical protein
MAWALERTNALTNSGVPMGTPTHFGPVDVKLGFSKILFIEFTETLERGVLVDVLEHKFASLLSGDTGDVKIDFVHVETQFRVLSKPLAHLNQNLEG